MNLPRDSIAPEERDTATLEESVLPEPRERRVVSATRARQGVTGHNVRYVLGFGLAGVVVAFVVVYIVYFA